MDTTSFLKDTHFGEKVQIDKMLETPFSKEIRICMAKGNTMQKHTAPGAIMIFIIKGKVCITSLQKSVELNSGDMIYFDAKVPHSLEAFEMILNKELFHSLEHSNIMN
jgi:quercetin dioxygenase-like cupin family protein